MYFRLYGLSVHEDTDEEQTEVVEDVATPPEKEEQPSGLFDIAQGIGILITWL